MSRLLDRELNLRFIVGFTVVLTLITIGLAALMWTTSTMLRGRLEGLDPAPARLPEARVQPLPPGPRLQAKPEKDLEQMRAEEDLVLSSYGWIDAEAGVARVPIEQAIEILSGTEEQEASN